jgi:hypothetical protein
MEAAALFYDLDGVYDTLKKRKAMVLDAMELEGIESETLEASNNNDMDGDLNDAEGDYNIGNNKEDDDFAANAFSWFSRDDAKKQKLIAE